MNDNIHIFKIGRLVAVVLPEYSWVTFVVPMPFGGTKQMGCTINEMIKYIEDDMARRKSPLAKKSILPITGLP